MYLTKIGCHSNNIVFGQKCLGPKNTQVLSKSGLHVQEYYVFI